MTPSIWGWMFTRQRSRWPFWILPASWRWKRSWKRRPKRFSSLFMACAAWLHDLLKPHVAAVLVCDSRKNASMKAGNKNDRADARQLAELLYLHKLHPVYHGAAGIRTLKELARSYLAITRDLTRVMSRLKAIYRSWAIPCAGQQV